jgi:single-strand DNA-binding protein
MSTVNKAIILGRLGKDPEVRNTGNADVANLSVATSETWKDKRSGERKEKTEWHRVTIWNENAIKFIEEHLKKGDQVYIEGKIETRKYEKDGQDHYTTEIIVPAFGGEVKKIWERDGNGGGNDRDNDRGSSRGGSRGGSSRGNDDRGSDDRGSSRGRGRNDDRGDDRGSDDRGSSRGGGRGGNSRDDRNDDRGGGSGRGGTSRGGGRNADMDDDIPF